jgi:mutator protein MutT
MRDESNRITTAGICIDKDNKVLIGKRIKKGTIGNTWEFPGGKNRWGETVEDTLKREFKEELGVDIEVKEELATHDFENKGVSYHLKAHRIVLKEDNPEFTLLVHTELKWEDFDKLDNYDFAPSDWAIILKLRQKHDII